MITHLQRHTCTYVRTYVLIVYGACLLQGRLAYRMNSLVISQPLPFHGYIWLCVKCVWLDDQIIKYCGTRHTNLPIYTYILPQQTQSLLLYILLQTLCTRCTHTPCNNRISHLCIVVHPHPGQILCCSYTGAALAHCRSSSGSIRHSSNHMSVPL